MEELFSQALGIEYPWKIESLHFNSDKKRLDIKVSFERGALFSYKDERTGTEKQYKAYDTVDKIWRHLNFFEHECYLSVRTPRIKPEQGGTKMIFPPWHGVVGGFTLLFEALLIEMCRHTPIHQVAKIMGLSDRKLWHMIECYVKKSLNDADHSSVSCLGLDETSRLRGHDYITLFVDLMTKKTIHVSEGKNHETVHDFVECFEDSKGDRTRVREVSCDMSPAFIKGVKTVFPQASITFDRFHIMKLVNEAVDSVRRAEAKMQPALKGARFALLKNETKLTSQQKKKRAYISQLNLKTSRALRLKETFQAIYQADTGVQFTTLLKEWYFWATHAQLEPFKKLAQTIKKHWDGIVRWKESQINNGILEGLNSVIQAAKRKARGYGEKHFKTMAYFLTGKLNFKTYNPHLPTLFA
ncbi:MAG: ISL3 family transposase [Aquabacterium sp.]|nr:MAG: ISL3 family transposase [Aquabacterium sp.]